MPNIRSAFSQPIDDDDTWSGPDTGQTSDRQDDNDIGRTPAAPSIDDEGDLREDNDVDGSGGRVPAARTSQTNG